MVCVCSAMGGSIAEIPTNREDKGVWPRMNANKRKCQYGDWLGHLCHPRSFAFICVHSRLKNSSTPADQSPRMYAKISGVTMVASDSIMNLGVSTSSLPQVIFSLGTAPEYPPKLVQASEV